MLTILKRAVSWPDGDAIKTIQPLSSSTIRKNSKATVLPPLTVRLIPSMLPPAGAVHCSTDPASRPSCDQQPASHCKSATSARADRNGVSKIKPARFLIISCLLRESRFP